MEDFHPNQLLWDDPRCHISEGFYLSNYDDVLALQMNAPDHFSRVGWKLGRDPSEVFSTHWYTSSYPDTLTLGMCPLEHYLTIGRYEGCTPLPGRLPDEREGVRGSPEFFNARLWSGFSSTALRGLWYLVRQDDEAQRAKALWILARWYCAVGDARTATDCLKQILQIPGKVNKRNVVALVKCLTILGDPQGIYEALGQKRVWERLGDMLPYILANALWGHEKLDSSRLALLNELFVRAALLPITLRNDMQGLMLANLGWQYDECFMVLNGPLVSVVIPAFNAETTLPTALKGLLEQTWRNLELIVVDDCSTDATAAVVEQFAATDARLRLIRNSANMGAYPSRNVGMRTARGEFVTVHDSDDWSHPQKIELQMQLLKDNSILCSLSNWTRVLPDMRFIGSWLLNERFVEVNHSSALFRRSLLDELGFWDEVNVAGDTEFLWRFAQRFGDGAIRTVLPEAPLSFALVLEDSLTRSKATHVRSIHFGLRRLYREAASWWHKAQVQPALPHDARAFPAPLGNCRASTNTFDTLIVTDFSTESQTLLEALAHIQSLLAENRAVALLHWPDYRAYQAAPIAPEVFALCHERGLQFVHQGLELVVRELVFVDAGLWDYPLESVPVLRGLEHVSTLRGDLPVDDVVAFFERGTETISEAERGL